MELSEFVESNLAVWMKIHSTNRLKSYLKIMVKGTKLSLYYIADKEDIKVTKNTGNSLSRIHWNHA